MAATFLTPFQYLQYANPAGTDPYFWSWYEDQNNAWVKPIHQEWTVIRDANIIQSLKVIATNIALNQTDTMTMTPTYRGTVGTVN